MDNKIRDALSPIGAPEELKRSTKAILRKRTFDYGRQTDQLRASRRRMAGVFTSLALVLAGLGVWFTPAASISLDINPSLEMQVNLLDRVIALEGKNDQGKALAAEMELNGQPYSEAMQRLLLSNGLAPYLEKGSTITITLTGTSDHAVQMLSNVVCRAYAIAREENVVYCQVDRATAKAAEEAGLSVPRYLAWQELKKTDPAVTVQEIQLMPMDEISSLIYVELFENPCGE